MASCHDIDPLLTPYLDEEAGGEERRDVEAHLQRCPACAERARAEGVARAVLRARAGAVSVVGPALLRRRCEMAAASSRPPQVERTERRRWLAPGLAAAAVVVLAVALRGFVASSPGLLVAELALDHLKCFALFEPHGGPADPQTVAAELTLRYGWRLAIPGSLARERLTLLGARRCFSSDGSVAHVLYRHGGRALSLFVVPATARPPSQVTLAGYAARIWSDRHATYVLLGRESEPEMRTVAAYFAGAGS